MADLEYKRSLGGCNIPTHINAIYKTSRNVDEEAQIEIMSDSGPDVVDDNDIIRLVHGHSRQLLSHHI